MKKFGKKSMKLDGKIDVSDTKLLFHSYNSKNIKLLLEFAYYCECHPEERFWQALRNWAKVKFIYISDKSTSINEKDTDIVNSLYDTFYFEGKDK